MAILTNNFVRERRPFEGGHLWGKQVTGYRQVLVTDYTTVLDYKARLTNVLSQGNYGLSNLKFYWNTSPSMVDNQWNDDVHVSMPNARNEVRLCYNKAYAKCMEALKVGSADMLAVLLERKKAAEMISDRTQQILAIANAVDSGNPKAIARSLGTTPSRLRKGRRGKGRSLGIASNPASTFLEVSWGWLPLLQDLASAVAYLGKDIPPMKVSGSSGFLIDVERHREWSNGFDHYSQGGRFILKVGVTCTPTTVVQTEIARLGLTNPGAAAWEVVSYSWLLDYFLSVGDVIEGWDDSLVLSYKDAYVTRYASIVEHLKYREYIGNPYNDRGWFFSRDRMAMNREHHGKLPGPYLVYHPDPFSPRRLAYLTALLTLRLKKFKALSNI